MDKSALRELTAQIAPEAAELRRAIHRNPELSGSEFGTARLVHDTLRGWGIAAHYHLDKTAVSAKIVSGKGPTVVLRADTDALPIQEENDVPYASKVPGVMHACGHDMHTAILLGAAKLLNQIKDQWKGTVLCLFQPSEEKEPGGALGLIKAGVFPPKAAAVFGMHSCPEYRHGVIAVKEGEDYAGVMDFEVTVRGRGGHGATPEKTVDPIVCASSIIIQLQTLISRELSSSDPAVLTVGSFHAGTKSNIIPDTAVFAGTVRTYSEELQDRLMTRIRELTESAAAAFGASAKTTFKKSYPSGYNDPALAQKFKAQMRSFLGNESVIDRAHPTMYAEDFARYQQLVPGLYIYLGIAPGNKKRGSDLHTSKFLPDERAINTGIAAHVLFALDILSEP
ncbi:MAG: M20 family metallopeptidase [Chitinispirillia bacterium]|nr:M20 family metallopeptidase [Chitinispirillia bacterium]MCL2268713.1 M20 family metallopeptidase [Chitinispirillia bacterium]